MTLRRMKAADCETLMRTGGCVCLLAALTLQVSGCNGASGTTVAGPSAASAVSAWISQPIVAMQPMSPPPNGVASCASNTHAIVSFNVFVTPSSSIDVNQVTVHMIDGTNLGGPAVPIPQPQATSNMGTTHIATGATRVFTFQSDLGCGIPVAQPHLSADILFRDATGVSRIVTVATPNR